MSRPRFFAPLAFAAPLALFAAPAAAQTVQPWPTIFVSAPVAPGWSVSGELINRISGDTRRPSQMEMRLELGRRLSKAVTLWGGYVHVATYRDGQPNGIEDQAVEQLNWTMGALRGVKFSSRFRLEQRFQRGADRTAWRARAQLRAAVPVARNGTALVAWTEEFIALNHTSTATTSFDQTRNFAGIVLPVSKQAEIEFGYLNQHLHRPSGDVSINAVPLVLSMRF